MEYGSIRPPPVNYLVVCRHMLWIIISYHNLPTYSFGNVAKSKSDGLLGTEYQQRRPRLKLTPCIMYFHVNYLNSFVNVQHLMPGSWTKSKQNRMRDTTITIIPHLEAIMLVNCICDTWTRTNRAKNIERERVLKMYD